MTIENEILELIVFEEPCPRCQMKLSWGELKAPEKWEWDVRWGKFYGHDKMPVVLPDPDCDRCDGKGSSPTELGEQILGLIRRHLKESRHFKEPQ